MLTLLLLRHAEAGWNEPGGRDIDRTLSENGLRTAPLVGRYLTKNDLMPAHIHCSQATRTRQTAELVLAEISGAPGPNAPDINYDKALYDGGADAYLEKITATDKTLNPLLLIGHNPAIHALAQGLSGDGNSQALGAITLKYPTAGLAILDFDLESWQDIAAQAGHLRDFITL